MKDDRMYELLALVLVCQHQLMPEIRVDFDITPEYHSIWIMYLNDKNLKQPKAYLYSSDGLDSCILDNFHRIHDTADLEQAEQHLMRLLKGETDDTV